MSIKSLLRHSWKSYSDNLKFILAFSIPLLFALPLASLLPNYVAATGVFLRFSSLQTDLTTGNALFIVLAFLFALLLYSFAITAINLIVKHQRTLTRIRHAEFEEIELLTLKLFTVFLAAFIAIFVGALWLRDAYPQHSQFLVPAWSLIVSLAILFVPQSLVLENAKLLSALKIAFKVLTRKFYYFVFFLLFASLLVLANTAVFLSLSESWPIALQVGVAVNALFILPFLEVLKTQIFLSKYSLLR